MHVKSNIQQTGIRAEGGYQNGSRSIANIEGGEYNINIEELKEMPQEINRMIC